MGPVLTVQLVVKIRDSHYQGAAQSLVHRSYPQGAERSYVHAYTLLSRRRQVFQRKCKQSLRNPAGREWVQDGFMGECVWAELEGWAGYWQAMRGEAIPNGRKVVKEGVGFHCLTLESSPPLPECSSTVSTVCLIVFLLLSLHHCWRALGMFLVDDIKPVSSFPNMPLVCMSAVQWKLFNLEENNMNKNTFLSVGRIVIYAQVRLFPLT